MHTVVQGTTESADRSWQRSPSLPSKACTLGQSVSCDLAGRQARDGQGTAKSAAQARKLFNRGCNMGYDKACKDRIHLDAPKKVARRHHKRRGGIKRHYDSIGRYIGYTDLSTGRRYDSTGRYLGQ